MTAIYHVPIAFAAAVNSSVVNTPLGQLDSTIDGFVKGNFPFTQINFGATTTLTINAGAITISRSRHRVDTQGGAATDDLDTIVGGQDGDFLRIQIVNNARVVVVRNNGGGTGNIRTPDGNNITLSTVNEYLDLVYDATNAVWIANAANITTLASVNVRDLITSTPAAWTTMNLPRAGFSSSGPGTAANQVFANLTPSWRKRITRYVTHNSNAAAPGISQLGINNAIVASSTAISSRTGGEYLTLTTGAVLNNHASIEGAVGSQVTERRHYPVVYGLIRTSNDVANFRILMVLTSGIVNDEAAMTGAGFRYNPATDSNWLGITRDGATLQTVDTGVAFATLTEYEWMFWMDDALGQAFFSINNSNPVSIAANLPASSQTLMLQVGTVTLAASSKTFEINRVAVESDG